MSTAPIHPIRGTSLDDVIQGTTMSDVISAGGGDDTVYGQSGNDEIWGGSGDDLLYGHSGNDVIYGSGGANYVQPTTIAIENDYPVRVIFEGETAGYRNSFGYYKVADDGTIYDVDIIWENASLQNSGGDLIAGQSDQYLSVSAGDQIGFFIVSNGYSYNDYASLGIGNYEYRDADGNPANLNSTNPSLFHVADDGTTTLIRVHTYHTAGYGDNVALNPDGILHTTGVLKTDMGTLTLGFEDLYNGGDMDFDDSVFTVDIGTENATILNAHYRSQDDSEDSDADDGDVTPPIPTDENDTLYGGSGADELWGKAGDDYLSGGTGEDELHGGSGNDTMYGDAAADLMYGNSGNDIMYGGSSSDILYGGLGDDTLYGGTSSDLMYGNSGNDIMHGGSSNDTLHGGLGDDTMYGGTAADLMYGNGGNDIMHGDSSNDTIYGGSGSDTIFGGSASDILNGGSDNDILWGGTGSDELNGDSGDDELYGENGYDTLSGGSGNDLIYGGSGHDIIHGGSGSDTLYGDSGADAINGNGGDDFIYGGSGRDTLNGGSGDDTFVSGTGRDVVNGGSGSDTIDYSDATRAVTIDLHGKRSTGGDSDTLVNIENAIGSAFDDTFRGNSKNNILEGGAGDDTLRGFTGSDTLTGGSGADVFVWYSRDIVDYLDEILDFSLVDDTINFVLGLDESADLDDWFSLLEFEGDTHLYVDLDGDVTTDNSLKFASLNDIVDIQLDDLTIIVA
ncbi:MAG: DUF4114 domain-containing protein [Rhizobiales bacterium]|nr:DUF4114 domain-containing protein [Hyphomicrobiales bacterium]NRB15596.1 DUF4114 domain-containing protein [Hyphomicrobiales bacterium]